MIVQWFLKLPPAPNQMKTFSSLSIQVGFSCLIAGMLLPNLHAELPATDSGPPVPVIDMHTHVFNSRDLPLSGAIQAMAAGWVKKPVANLLREAFLTLTAPDDLDGPFPPPAKVEGNAEDGSAILSVPTTESAATATVAPRVLTSPQRDQLRAIAGMKPTKGINVMESKAQAVADRQLLAQALRNVGFPPQESGETSPENKMLSVGLDGYLRFVDIMTDGNLRIAYRLITEEYPKTDLFVHHMMDMEMGYAEKPQFPFADQIQRMARLDNRMQGDYTGRLIHFVAFDPFRREKALETMLMGLKAGAVGVKFYPPSGYRATGNEIPKRPGWSSSSASKERWDSRYKHLKNSQLDQIIDGLFRYCVSNDLPIFTHCTPAGFEADRDYGWMADPQFWGQVLSNYPTLKLCFGHSGGEAYWFADGKKSVDKHEHRRRSFGTNVVQLCLTYPNVYCEVGYLEPILETKSFGLYTNRLASVINRVSVDGQWRFGDKLMYGTDWHMLHKVDHHERYLAAFDQIMTRSTFASYHRKFFSGNATKFLNLKKLLADNRFTDGQQKVWAELAAKAEFAAPVSPTK
ncbi:MAG: amidohydrolase family protein [Verrucomicrobiota bacterium]